VGISELDLRVFSKCLNSRHMGLPFKYLGMPIGGNPRKRVFWNPVVEKIRSRLSRWKGRLLSMAGRICLIKSVISALPLFYFSFFRAPTTYVTRLDVSRHSFSGDGAMKVGRLLGRSGSGSVGQLSMVDWVLRISIVLMLACLLSGNGG